MISSLQNPIIKYVRNLQAKTKFRRTEAVFVIEGVRLVEEANEAKWEFNLVLYSEELSERGLELVDSIASRGTRLEEVSSQVMRALSETKTPQGIMAVVPMQPYHFPDELDFVVILDQVRNPGNLGTILRTAAAARVQVVFLTPGSVDPYSPKVIRGAMGAHFRIPVRTAPWEEILPLIKKAEMHAYLAAADRGHEYTRVDFQPPLALIIGGEAEGAGETAFQGADSLIHISMPGGGESLNASVAAGILIFEVVRQRGLKS